MSQKPAFDLFTGSDAIPTTQHSVKIDACVVKLQEALGLLSNAPKSAGQLIHRFIECAEPFAKVACINVDGSAAVAQNFRIVFEPSDGLRELLLAVGALEFDRG